MNIKHIYFLWCTDHHRSTKGCQTFRIYKPLTIIDKHETDLFHGVLIDLRTKDQTPELISLAERESSYSVGGKNINNDVFGRLHAMEPWHID